MSPPRCLPVPEVTNVWRVYCEVKGWCCYVTPGLVDADGALEATEHRLRCEARKPREKISCNGVAELWDRAFLGDTMEFLDFARETFEGTLAQLEGDDPAIEATREELRCFIRGLPDLKTGRSPNNDRGSHRRRKQGVG